MLLKEIIIQDFLVTIQITVEEKEVIKVFFDKVENELPDSKYLLKQIVKEARYNVNKPPSAESLGITHMRGLFAVALDIFQITAKNMFPGR